MKVAILTTDSREYYRDYDAVVPYFGAAPEALLQGLTGMPGLEVHVISCAQKPMKSAEKLAENIWFHGLYVPKTGWMRTSYQGCIRAVRRKLKVIQPDIVHGQGTERDCAVCAVFSRFPNVLTIHGNMGELARLFKAPLGSFAWLAAQLENITLKRTRGVFCNSEYTEGLVKPRAPKTWRVPNPIRAPFYGPPKGQPSAEKCVLLNVGVISERKRQLELLAQARRWHEQGLKIELQFIGHVEPKNAYAAKFLEEIRGAQDYASYLGLKSVEDLIACFDAAHGLVHFPSEEAFGLVVAEAMAREVKFFGARLGGMLDICSGVPDAELYGADDWGGLSEGIERWIRNGYPRSVGAAAVVKARYHPEVIARRHVEIYREVLSKE